MQEEIKELEKILRGVQIETVKLQKGDTILVQPKTYDMNNAQMSQTRKTLNKIGLELGIKFLLAERDWKFAILRKESACTPDSAEA